MRNQIVTRCIEQLSKIETTKSALDCYTLSKISILEHVLLRPKSIADKQLRGCETPQSTSLGASKQFSTRFRKTIVFITQKYLQLSTIDLFA